MNISILTGRLTRDPETRHTSNGNAYSTFTLAVPRDYSKEECDFLDIVAWNKKAEIVQKYLGKGDKIGIVGKQQKRSYENKDGNKVYITENIMEKIEFIETKKAKNNNNQEEETINFEELAEEMQFD